MTQMAIVQLGVQVGVSDVELRRQRGDIEQRISSESDRCYEGRATGQ